ncbi:MAG: Dabb family protein [Nitrospirae bacterium]|nr:Dabb family protein [Nitrospirota bacterium]NTW66498.1 Dabb family protein [Nitrospirota bacterium]
MLKHIVLFKLRENAESASKEANAKKIKRDLESLKGVIPQIRHMEVGINCIPGDAAYDVAIYSEFANEADLSIYAKHPEHVKVAEFVGKVRESRVVVDYIL